MIKESVAIRDSEYKYPYFTAELLLKHKHG